MNCPTCNREMEHHEYQPADPEVGVREAPEEWVCVCGQVITERTPGEVEADAIEEAGHNWSVRQ